MKNQKGFSLIELLIVVVIIGIIAAIAIPNLLAARRAANEASAISSLRTLHGAQVTYSATSTPAVGDSKFGTLAQLSTANLIDSTLAGGDKSGYSFTNTADGTGSASTFTATADPTTPTGLTATGYRFFGIATEGVIVSDTATITGDGNTLSGGTALNN